jgi:NAD(P)-dependent dehydrogenase (short-subunit alcohol dehydrogenase family)
MMRRDLREDGGRGAIVNVSSVFGLVGAENSAGYSASKAALSGLTTQMATDYGPSGIRINAVAPGLIETPLTVDRIRNQPWRSRIMVDEAPIRRLGRSEDVAYAIRFLASDEAAYITGLILPVDGGWISGRFPRETPLG